MYSNKLSYPHLRNGAAQYFRPMMANGHSFPRRKVSRSVSPPQETRHSLFWGSVLAMNPWCLGTQSCCSAHCPVLTFLPRLMHDIRTVSAVQEYLGASPCDSLHQPGILSLEWLAPIISATFLLQLGNET